jgi:hypothetical protein
MRNSQPAGSTKIAMHTRPHRRKAVKDMIALLNTIMDLEADYRDNIPEQFEQRREAADHACAQLEEAIMCLNDAF